MIYSNKTIKQNIKFVFFSLAIVSFCQTSTAQQLALPYDNEMQVRGAALTQIANADAIARQYFKTCAKPKNANLVRLDRLKLEWQVRNKAILQYSESWKAILRKASELGRGLVDEDTPQIAEATANVVVMSAELLEKRLPGTLQTYCDSVLTAIEQERFDLKNRLDVSVKAYIEKELATK